MQNVVFVPGLFLSTLSLRRATDVIAVMTDAQSISIHALLAESDESRQLSGRPTKDFYPRSPCGERLMYALILANTMLFLSTLSLRRATSRLHYSDLSRLRFLSTLSLRRATQHTHVSRLLPRISIHALLAESDVHQWDGQNGHAISIHALLAESDKRQPGYLALIHSFLSTLSLRRATTHPVTVFICVIISIHALLAESDPHKTGNNCIDYCISIHALLAESDDNTPIKAYNIIKDFYPRSPCGERQCMPSYSPTRCYFYPRSPCGERPVPQQENGQAATISIHALLAESDMWPWSPLNNDLHFYPRSPCGERHGRQRKHGSYYYFYPRSPCGERRLGHGNWCKVPHISIHALLAESDGRAM